MIVRFVDIGGIDDYGCLNIIFFTVVKYTKLI